MTVNEAIEQIRHNDCAEFCMNVEGNCSECRWGVAITALEKQIPEVPFYEGDGYADGEPVIDTWICPNCGKDYELECYVYDYCPNCGQAINWEDDWEYAEIIAEVEE